MARCDQRELVVQVQRVLDESDDAPGHTVSGKGVADVHAERRRSIASHRDVAGTGRETAGDEAQGRSGELAVRILRSKVHRVERSRDCDALVINLLDHTERAPGRHHIGAIGTREAHLAFRGPHRRIEADCRVVRERHADSGRRDREHQKRHHQHLLAPLAAEQPQRPTEDRAARGRATGTGPVQLPRPVLERQAHDTALGASSDSGPAGGIV